MAPQGGIMEAGGDGRLAFKREVRLRHKFGSHQRVDGSESHRT